MDIPITVVLNFLLLIGLWWLLFIELKSYRLDLTRQKLFKIRDELFDLAEKGELSFDSKAYGLMRTTLNGMIQFTHKLSFIRFVATITVDQKVLKGRISSEFKETMNTALSDIPVSARKKILDSRNRMHRVMIRHIIYSSISLSALFVLVSTLHLTHMIGSSLVGSKPWKEKWSAIDAEAEQLGIKEQKGPHCPAKA